MDSSQSFEFLAEVSIALVGFAGVVVALARAKLHYLALRLRLTLLFINGSTALWGSLTPTISSISTPETNTQIFIAGLMYMPVLMAVNVYAWVQFATLIRNNEIVPRTFYILTPFIVASLIYLVVSLVALPNHIQLAHFISIVIMLFLGLYHFYILTTSIMSNESADT